LQAIYKVLRPNDEKPTFEDMTLLLKNELKKEKEEKTNFLFVLDNLIENKKDKWVEHFLALMPENVFILITSRNSNVLSDSKIINKYSQSLEVKYFTKEQGEEFFKENINKDRDLSKNETDLLEKYFNGGQVLPYDLNLLVNVLNENELLTIDRFLTGYKELWETIFDELYKIEETIYPDKSHPSLASTYGNIGNVYHEMGDLPSALKYLLDAIKINEAIYPDKCHPSLAITYGNIGNVYHEMGDFPSALKYQLDAMKIKETIFTDKFHPSLAITYGKIGNVYQDMRDFPSALKYQLDAMNIQEAIFPDKCHPSLADTYVKIGNVYRIMGDFPSALKYQLDAMKIQETIYPDKCHPSLANTYENIGNVYQDMGDFPSSLKYLNLKDAFKINK
jgi:tetratricopeptide (TPR) repeat protein